MQRRTWIGLACVAAAILVASIGNGVGGAARDGWFLAGGVLLVASACLFLSLLPFWRRLSRLPPLPGLFPTLRPNQRWCTRCGRPAPSKGPCPSCGIMAARERRAQRRLQRKQRARRQEKKTQGS